MSLKDIIQSRRIDVEKLLEILVKKIEKVLTNNEMPAFITVSYWSFSELKPYIHFRIINNNDKNKINKFIENLLKLIKDENFSLTQYIIEKNIKKNLLFKLNQDNNDSFYNQLGYIKEDERVIINKILELHKEFLKDIIEIIYFIPLKSFITTQPIIGVLVVNTSCEYDDEVLSMVELFAKALFASIHETEFEYLITSHALRSAVAAIMARNMSHNIGSHVLNYLSNPEELDNLWII